MMDMPALAYLAPVADELRSQGVAAQTFAPAELAEDAILAEADAEGKIEWSVSFDATIARAHQHASNTTRPEQDTGGLLELQEIPAGGR